MSAETERRWIAKHPQHGGQVVLMLDSDLRVYRNRGWEIEEVVPARDHGQWTEDERLVVALDAARAGEQAMMDALSTASPEVGQRIMREPSYQRFLAALGGIGEVMPLTGRGVPVAIVLASKLTDAEAEIERLRGLLAEVDAHYSGSLDHQPGYVKRIREFLADAA